MGQTPQVHLGPQADGVGPALADLSADDLVPNWQWCIHNHACNVYCPPVFNLKAQRQLIGDAFDWNIFRRQQHRHGGWVARVVAQVDAHIQAMAGIHRQIGVDRCGTLRQAQAERGRASAQAAEDVAAVGFAHRLQRPSAAVQHHADAPLRLAGRIVEDDAADGAVAGRFFWLGFLLLGRGRRYGRRRWSGCRGFLGVGGWP